MHTWTDLGENLDKKKQPAKTKPEWKPEDHIESSAYSLLLLYPEKWCMEILLDRYPSVPEDQVKDAYQSALRAYRQPVTPLSLEQAEQDHIRRLRLIVNLDGCPMTARRARKELEKLTGSA